MERDSLMSGNTNYGALDAAPAAPAAPGPTPPPHARLSTESAKSHPTAGAAVLPIVSPGAAGSASANGNGNGNENGSVAGASTGTGKRRAALRAWMARSVDSRQCTLISVANCFLTGFTSAVAFTACYIW